MIATLAGLSAHTAMGLGRTREGPAAVCVGPVGWAMRLRLGQGGTADLRRTMGEGARPQLGSAREGRSVAGRLPMDLALRARTAAGLGVAAATRPGGVRRSSLAPGRLDGGGAEPAGVARDQGRGPLARDRSRL